MHSLSTFFSIQQPMSITMLGVRVDQLPKVDVLILARQFILSDVQKRIFTPNPEMLVKAHYDRTFRQVLNKGDINVCDGIGLRIASQFQLPRISGVDLMFDLCALAENEGKRVFLLGSNNESIVAETAEVLRQRFPALILAGVHRGPEVTEREGTLQVDQASNTLVLDYLNRTKPDVLFVAFGMGKQEKWLEQYLAKVPSVKLAVGVGGAFDFISGRVRRAPLLLRKLGLEWLYRLARQPWRLGRIFNATVTFTYLFIKGALSAPSQK